MATTALAAGTYILLWHMKWLLARGALVVSFTREKRVCAKLTQISKDLEVHKYQAGFARLPRRSRFDLGEIAMLHLQYFSKDKPQYH